MKRRALALVLLSLALVAGACGDDEPCGKWPNEVRRDCCGDEPDTDCQFKYLEDVRKECEIVAHRCGGEHKVVCAGRWDGSKCWFHCVCEGEETFPVGF